MELLRSMCRAAVPALFVSVSLGARGAGMVEGVVVNSVTRAGLNGVTVELTAQGADNAAYRVTTDSMGRFGIANVAEGKYLATYELDGFTGPDDDPADRAFQVMATVNPVRLRQELVPLAELGGRVLDSEGVPLEKAAVECLEAHSGQVRMVAVTDSDGRFSIERLPPGRYLLRAAPSSNFYAAYVARAKSREESEKQTDVNPNRKLWPATYYPHAIDRLLASAITVRGGEDMQGYEIRLQQTSAFRIQGAVLDERGSAAGGVRVKLKSADSVDWMLDAPPYAQTTTRDDGSFEFPTVGPGHWRLIAQMKNPAGELMGFASLAVTRNDLEDVRLSLTAPFTLTAIVEGLPPDVAERKVPRQIRLIPVDGPVEQEVYSSGRTTGGIQARVFPGRYRFSVGGPAGYYLDAILMGDRDVTADEVDMTASSPAVRLIYRADGGRLQGTVKNGGGTNVALFPQNPALLFENLHLRVARCDDDGRFEIGGIRPGDYYAIAVDRVEWDAFESPAFTAALANNAARVRVEAGAAVTVELRGQPWPE